MRIVFVTQWFDPEPGAIRGLPLARWLVERGHSVKVITGVPNYPAGKIYDGYKLRFYQWEYQDGVEILRVPLYPSHDSSSIRRVANYLSFALSAATIGVSLIGQADVAYVYHPPPTVGLASSILKWLKGIPNVYHIADMWPESVLESGMVGQPGLKRAILEKSIGAWCKFVYRQAEAITVLSPGFKRLLIDRGVPAEKVHVVYNWTDDNLFKPLPQDDDLRTSLSLDGKFAVVYAGNLGPMQALETAIDAAEILKDRHEIQFVFVGTGSREAALKDYMASKKLTNVTFVGRQDYQDMPRYNSIADALLVHLRDLPFFASTVPSKTQVSLASEKPILMGVRGDAATIVQEAKAGICFSPESSSSLAEAVCKLSELSSDERKQLGQNGYAFYKSQMSLECGAQQMLSIFQAIATPANSTGSERAMREST